MDFDLGGSELQEGAVAECGLDHFRIEFQNIHFRCDEEVVRRDAGDNRVLCHVDAGTDRGSGTSGRHQTISAYGAVLGFLDETPCQTADASDENDENDEEGTSAVKRHLERIPEAPLRLVLTGDGFAHRRVERDELIPADVSARVLVDGVEECLGVVRVGSMGFVELLDSLGQRPLNLDSLHDGPRGGCWKGNRG